MEWRPIPGYEGVYSVSDEGQVRRDGAASGAVQGRIRRLWRRPDGYYMILLSKACKKQSLLVHAVVATAFHGPRPSPTHQVNHKDGVKANNRADNLEWATPSENQQHAVATGLRVMPRGLDVPRTKLTDDQVRAIRASTGTTRSVASLFGVHHSVIWKIRAGHARTYVEAPS